MVLSNALYREKKGHVPSNGTDLGMMVVELLPAATFFSRTLQIGAIVPGVGVCGDSFQQGSTSLDNLSNFGLVPPWDVGIGVPVSRLEQL